MSMERMDRLTDKSLHKAIKSHNTKDALELLQKYGANQGTSDGNIFFKGSEPVLCTAIAEGQIEVVCRILELNADVETGSKSTGQRPLHIAAKHGQVAIADMLLKKGAQIDQLTDTGDTVLYVAVAGKQLEMVNFLLRAGADVNVESSYLYSRNYVVHGAASHEDPTILNVILAANANVNLRNDDQRTALHIAASHGRAANVERLLACGAKVDLFDSSNKSALQMACEKGHVEVVRMLCVAGAVIDCDRTGQDHPLEVAVTKRYINVVRTLLHFGADVNREFSGGKTAIHRTITNCNHKMSEKWSGGRTVSVNIEIEMLDSLLQFGASLNVRDQNGNTPLHVCVKDGCESVLDYLINSGADYIQVNNEGLTPLQLACKYNVSRAVEVLIQNCPGLVNHMNHVELDKTPMVILWEKRNLDCLRLLCDAGYTATNAEKYFIEMKQRETRKKVDGPIKSLLTKEFQNPWRLSRCCRTAIRDILHDDLERKVTFLPVPERMMDSIQLLNLHTVG